MNAPLLTKNQIRECAWRSSHVGFPGELVNELYHTYVVERGCIDDSDYWQYYTQQDTWDHIRMYIVEYSQMNRNLDEASKFIKPWGSAPHPEVYRFSGNS